MRGQSLEFLDRGKDDFGRICVKRKLCFLPEGEIERGGKDRFRKKKKSCGRGEERKMNFARR